MGLPVRPAPALLDHLVKCFKMLQKTEVEKKSLSINLPYEPSMIKGFWKGTSDDVKITVEAAARVERSKNLSKEHIKRLSRQERMYLDSSSAEELERLLQKYLDRATERLEIAKEKQTKLKRASNKSSNFLVTFHGYVEAYSGVIQIMNGAPGPVGYGNAAYAALSLFFMVSVNKAKTEELIDTMMHTLQQEYYRIKIVNKVHPTDRMKEQTAVVYRLGVEFLYSAVRYYSMSTFRRLWHVVARPPNIELTEKIAEIEIAVEEIRKEMEVLDSKRIKDIEIKLDDQSIRIDRQAVKIDRTEKDVLALRKEIDRERLEYLQQTFGVNLDEVDHSIENYDDLLNETFDMRDLEPLDVQQHLYQNKFFRMWHQSDDFRLLVLQGSTEYPTDTDLSWLSTGATHVICSAFEIFQNTSLLLRYLCQTKDNCGGYKVAGRKVISSLIFQLLRTPRGQSLIRDNENYARVKHDIEAVNQVDPDRPSEILRLLFDMLGHLIKTAGLQRIVIVVDRLDVVEGDLENFMEPLLKFMVNVEFTVKVMLTVSKPRSLSSRQMKRELGEIGYNILEIDQDD